MAETSTNNTNISFPMPDDTSPQTLHTENSPSVSKDWTLTKVNGNRKVQITGDTNSIVRRILDDYSNASNVPSESGTTGNTDQQAAIKDEDFEQELEKYTVVSGAGEKVWNIQWKYQRSIVFSPVKTVLQSQLRRVVDIIHSSKGPVEDFSL